MFTKKLLSIDIGSQNIKISIGKCSKNKVYIEKLITLETPIHCIDDGKIIDRNKLTENIKDILEMNAVKEKEVIFTTNSTDIINREMAVPEAEGEELDTIVQFEIQQYLPIIMEDYIIQHNVLEHVQEDVSSEEGALNKLKVLVVTYPKRMAEQYLKLAEDLKLMPKALDVNFNAVSKLFKDDVEINKEKLNVGMTNAVMEIGEHNITPSNKLFIGETIAVIDMGAEKININIFNNGKMDFSRIIASGGSVIDRNIARNFDINVDEAEKRKKEFCDLLNEKGIEHMEELNTIIKETITGWIDEMGRVLQFYRNKNIGNKIDKVFIYGGSSRLKGLAVYMEKMLNIKVSNINFMSNIELSKDVIKEDMDCFLNSIGALIRL